MGYATTRTLERVLAAVGKLGAPAPVEFESACDVAGGGVRRPFQRYWPKACCVGRRVTNYRKVSTASIAFSWRWR